jgi:hypothetical protein
MSTGFKKKKGKTEKFLATRKRQLRYYQSVPRILHTSIRPKSGKDEMAFTYRYHHHSYFGSNSRGALVGKILRSMDSIKKRDISRTTRRNSQPRYL